MEIKAQLKFLHIAPRKVRLVAHVIKGMEAKRALIELGAMTKRSAQPITKLLLSAIANGEYNFKQERNDVVIKEIVVNPGPVYKRSMPRAFGRSSMIRKRTSHVIIMLGTRKPNTKHI